MSVRFRYDKPSISISDQIELLRHRGMAIENEKIAFDALSQINYYRLSAYWHIFRSFGENQGHNYFMPFTSFETVLAIYERDRFLRQSLMEAIGHIEIAIRAYWSQNLAMLGDAHAYLVPKYYKNRQKFDENVERLAAETKKSGETFLKHYREKYSHPELPPVWMASEILSLGNLSHWYANLKELKTRKGISEPFGLEPSVFATYVHHLSVVRNICAHHGRLWNRTIPVPLKFPKKDKTFIAKVNTTHNTKVYNTLIMIDYTMQKLGWKNDWFVKTERIIAPLIALDHNGNYLGYTQAEGMRALKDFRTYCNQS